MTPDYVGDRKLFRRLLAPWSGVALVGFVLLLLYLAAAVVTPILFAFFLAALAMPFYRGLQRRGLEARSRLAVC